MSRTVRALIDRVRRSLTAPAAEQSDRALLQRFVAAQDEAAFTLLVERHGGLVREVCRRVLDDEHLADDAFQAAFLVLARKAASIRKGEALANWLFGVSRRVAQEALRRRIRQRHGEQRAALTRPEAVAGEPPWEELLAILHEELARLPDKYRAPLLLCYLEGRTQDEAAQQLGQSLSTVRRRLDQGRELLRLRMTRRGATLSAGLFASLFTSRAATAVSPLLVRSTVAAGMSWVHGVAPTSEAAALAEGVLPMISASRLRWFLGALLSLALLAGGAGAVWYTTRTSEPDQAPAPPAPSPEVKESNQERPQQRPGGKVDRFNTPLPKGALARLGTINLRHGGLMLWVLAFAAGDKILVSQDEGVFRRWDLTTGRLVVQMG
jgi:RNA polymerase sigma factor (sigma-70 family)